MTTDKDATQHDSQAHADEVKAHTTTCTLDEPAPPDLKQLIANFAEWAAGFPGYIESHLIEDGEKLHLCAHYNTAEGAEAFDQSIKDANAGSGRSEADTVALQAALATRKERGGKRVTGDQLAVMALLALEPHYKRLRISISAGGDPPTTVLDDDGKTAYLLVTGPGKGDKDAWAREETKKILDAAGFVTEMFREKEIKVRAAPAAQRRAWNSKEYHAHTIKDGTVTMIELRSRRAKNKEAGE